jgi:protein SCO1
MADRLNPGRRPVRVAAGRDEAFVLWSGTFILAVTVFWWAFALWPVGDAPDWLLRTRLVCFGVDGGGLPDRAGWVALVGQPLGMLGALLVGWRGAVGGAVRVLVSTTQGRMLGGTAAAVVLIAVAGLGWRVSAARIPAGWTELEGVPATYPRIDRPAPALDLIDHTGAAFSTVLLEGRPAIVTFAFAHCETVCPVLVRNALDARQRLASGSGGSAQLDVAVVVVTLDPWRDTPARLPHVARSWGMGDGTYLLGGLPADVEAVLDAWQVARERDMRTGDVAHPALSYIVDARGRIAYATTGGSDALAELVRRL